MTEPYYQDEYVTLYHGRCEDILPTLATSGDVHLVTDPPYFGVKSEAWDNQWDASSDFLDWMGKWLDLAKPLLSPNASVWVFASPQLTSSVERVVGERFRLLNTVRWVKPQGWHQKAELASLRSFLSGWEGIVFAEQYADAYGEEAKALHREVFAPMGRYLLEERERSGFSRREVAARLSGYKNLESATANVSNWELGKNLINERDYASLRGALNSAGGEYLRREYEDLRREYEDLRREYEDQRRPFSARSRELAMDVWTFDPVSGYPGKHPCEKPLSLMTHIIESTTRPGDTVIDCFAGSGAILDAARKAGRKAIGIEMDEHWCEVIAKRLAQQTLFEGVF